MFPHFSACKVSDRQGFEASSDVYIYTVCGVNSLTLSVLSCFLLFQDFQIVCWLGLYFLVACQPITPRNQCGSSLCNLCSVHKELMFCAPNACSVFESNMGKMH